MVSDPNLPQKSLSHAAVGCISAGINGGSCRSAAISGGFAAAVGGYLETKGWDNIATRALVGGAGSQLSGGKFVNGAFTASFSYLLNDLGNHDKEEKPTLSTSAKVGAVLGGTAGVVLAAGCDLATFATCAPANPMMVLGGAAGGAVLGATFGEALDRTTKAIGKLLHGNSWLSPEPSSVYALLSRFDGSIQKFGVTNLVGNETARYTSAEYERMDVRMVTISTHPTRAQALTTEKLYCFGYVAVVGRTPPLSKVC